MAKEEITQFQIDKATVEKALGSPNSMRELVNDTPRVGVVNGLACTSVGGEMLPIEAVNYEGNGKLTITGQLAIVPVWQSLLWLGMWLNIYEPMPSPITCTIKPVIFCALTSLKKRPRSLNRRAHTH